MDSSDGQGSSAENPTQIVLCDAIDSGLVECAELGGGGLFLPEDKINMLASRSNIQKALENSKVTPRNSLVDFILHKAKRTFLTLERIREVAAITQLKDEGFCDEYLPLGAKRCTSDHSPNQRIVGPLNEKTGGLHREKWPTVIANWRYDKVENFCYAQWYFLTPVFGEAVDFFQRFDKGRQLPFTHTSQQASRQAIIVYKVTIHEAHTDLRPPIVALKSVRSRGGKDYLRKELNMLLEIKKLKHDHLIEPLATFDNTKLQCALFPWYNGGNLLDYWKGAESSILRDEAMILWTLRQIAGLCDCLQLLWLHNCKHGDLKPQNILYPGNRGNFVIADVGISKIHEDETTLATRRYGAPELWVGDIPHLPLSRNYDIWSMGCIVYEWLYWLLYGLEGLRNIEHQCEFWEDEDEQGKITVARPVLTSIEEMRRKLNAERSDNALKDLLSLVDKRLLVIGLGGQSQFSPDKVRAKASELSSITDRIKTRAEQDSSYRFSARIWDQNSKLDNSEVSTGGALMETPKLFDKVDETRVNEDSPDGSNPRTEDEAIPDDESEISEASSILSTFSSSSSMSSEFSEPHQDAAMHFVDILSQDPVLKRLYPDLVEKVSREKFCRKHSALLKQLFNRINLEADENLYRSTVQMLQSTTQRRRVSGKLWEIFISMKNPQGANIMHQLDLQRPDRMNRLNDMLKSDAEQATARRNYHQDSPDDRIIRLLVEDDSDAEEEDGEDEKEALSESQGLPHLELVVSSLIEEPAFHAFKKSVECSINRPTTLADALVTHDVGIIKGLLNRRLRQVAQGEYGWIGGLDEMGLSKRGIAALILERVNGPADKISLQDLERTETLSNLANQLGTRYSKTRAIEDLEGAIKLEQEAMRRTTPDHASRTRWLNNIGSRSMKRYSKTTTRADTKAVLFEWEIPSIFLDSNCGEIWSRETIQTDLSNFVVLSGSHGAFEVLNCLQYLETNFGEAGCKALNFVVAALEHVYFLDTPGQVDHQGYAAQSEKSSDKLIFIGASRSCIVLTTEETGLSRVFVDAMRWLCEAIRATPNALCDQSNSILKSGGIKSLELGASQAGAAIIGFSLEPLQQMTQEEIGQSCWTKLFKVAIVAWRPLQHPWGNGLKLPYEMLVQLAAVTNYLRIDSSTLTSQPSTQSSSGLVALGFFTALIPIAQNQDLNSIQWHLEVSDKSIISPDSLEAIKGPWLKVDNADILTKSTCFLGWKEKVNVLLGTENGKYNLDWTTLDKQERIFCSDGFAIGGEVGVGGIIPIDLKGNFAKAFKPRSTIQNFIPEDDYKIAVLQMSEHVTFIFDAENQTAWLVPQLSWLLHLCHIWYRRNPNSDDPDPVPYADVSTNGYYAACKAIIEHGDLPIICSIRFNHIFLGLYHALSATSINRPKPTSHIYGSESMDLIIRSPNGSPLRKLKIGKERDSWRYLAEKADTVCFCRGIGQVLEPHDKDLSRTCGCDTVPCNRSLLVAHNLCIDRLLEREGARLNDLQKSFIELKSPKCRWAMEKWPFDPCPHDRDYWNANTGTILQRMDRLKLWESSKSNLNNQRAHSTSPPESGAFVFGA